MQMEIPDLLRGRALWTALSQHVYLLLTYLLIHSNPVLIHIRRSSRLHRPRLGHPFSFSHPPAPALPPSTPHRGTPPTRTQPGRGGPMEGVHPPTPSTFAPWCSRHLVVCFYAPSRLPAKSYVLLYYILLVIARNTRKKKHKPKV